MGPEPDPASPPLVIPADSARGHGVALLLYVALAMWLTVHIWVAAADQWVGGGDCIIIAWCLRWTPYALAHAHNPFFTDHLKYPIGVNLMWQAQMFLAGLGLAPVSAMFGPKVAKDVAYIVAFALSAWCAYRAIGRWTRSRAAAFVGGLVYGFSPYMVAQTPGHLHVAMAFTPPILLLVLDELLVRQRWRPTVAGVVLGLLTGAQLLIGEEMLASEALTAAVGLLILVIVGRRRVAGAAPYAARALFVAFVVFGTIAIVPLYVQFFGPQQLGNLEPPDTFVTDLLNLVVPGPFQWIRPAAADHITKRFTGNLAEWNGYLGVPLLLFVAIQGLRLRRVPIVRFSGLMLVAVTVLSLGPHLHVAGRVTRIALPWAAIHLLPVLGEDMVPCRMMVHAFLFAAIVMAVGLDAMLRAGGVRGAGGALACAVTIVVSLLPNAPYAAIPIYPVPEFFRGGEVRRIPAHSVALVAPFTFDHTDAQPMIWQAAAGMRFRMPAAYMLGGTQITPLSSTMRRIFEGDGPVELTPASRRTFLEQLAQWQIRTVIVGPMPHQDDMVHFITALLGRSGEPSGGVIVWWKVDHAASELRT